MTIKRQQWAKRAEEQHIEETRRVVKAYSGLSDPHLSQGSFWLLTEGTWDMSWICSSVQQLSVAARREKHINVGLFLDLIWDLICSPTLRFTDYEDEITYCLHTGSTPSGVAPGWAWPCVYHLEDTPPPSGSRQSGRPPKPRKLIAKGMRWGPSL